MKTLCKDNEIEDNLINGYKVIKFKIDNDYYNVYRFNIIDKNGKKIEKYNGLYKDVLQLNSDYLVFKRDNGSCGILNLKLNKIICNLRYYESANYENISLLNNGYIKIPVDEEDFFSSSYHNKSRPVRQYNIIDNQGNIIVYHATNVWDGWDENGMCVIQKRSSSQVYYNAVYYTQPFRHYLIDEKGKIISSIEGYTYEDDDRYKKFKPLYDLKGNMVKCCYITYNRGREHYIKNIINKKGYHFFKRGIRFSYIADIKYISDKLFLINHGKQYYIITNKNKKLYETSIIKIIQVFDDKTIKVMFSNGEEKTINPIEDYELIKPKRKWYQFWKKLFNF